ncbi:MAG: DUF222 domain-containing protein [Micromonosporaceae bacterium]
MSRAFGVDAHPVADAFNVMGAQLDKLSDVPLWSLSDGDVGELLGQAARLESRLAALKLRLVAEADGRDLGRRAGAPSTQTWLRSQLAATPQAAKAQVRLAAALRRREATLPALAAGRISPAHARVVADAVEELPEGTDPQMRERAERYLVECCERFDPHQVAKLGRRILDVIDPDAADEYEGERLAELEKRAWRRRELRFTPDGHGSVFVRGRLDVESAAVVRRALDPLAKPRPADTGRPDPRSAGARTADALVELCRRALVAGGLPVQRGERPQLVVTIDHAQLREETGTGVLDTGERLSPGVVRRLACDAQVLPAVLGGDSRPLDLGRAVRVFSGPQRRALMLRDRGCAFPDCDRPPHWAEAHHVTHWVDGGSSDLGNAVLLCGFHHREIHQGHWRVKIATNGYPEFTPPRYIDPAQIPIRNHLHHLHHKRR